MTIANIAVWYAGKLRVNPKSSHRKEKFSFIFFLLFFVLCVSDGGSYCGNCFTIYANEPIILCVLNVYSDAMSIMS